MEPILFTGVLFALSCALATAVIPPLKRIAYFFRLTDDPHLDLLKIHTRPIPFVGGCAIELSLSVSIGLLMSGVIPNPLPAAPALGYLVGTLSISILVLLFGFWDDLKWRIRTESALAKKIFSQILMAVCAAAIFLATDMEPIIGVDELAVGVISGFVLLVIVNASNIHDGLDGLLAGLTLVSALGFLLFFLIHDHLLGVALASILAGSLTGFLIFNVPPASIFLGDNGSYLIGGLLTILLFLSMNSASVLGILGPLLLVGMPLVNLAYVISRRILTRQSPISADRYHIYDRVHRATGSVKKTLIIHLAAQCLLVGGGVALTVQGYV